MQQRGNPLATSVLSAANVTVTHKVDVDEQIKALIHQLANPTVATPQIREQVTQLKSQLVTAQQGGNDLAATVLSTAEKVGKKELTAEEEKKAVEEIKGKVEQQKVAGDPLAQTVNNAVQKTQTQAQQSLPVVNRVQQVSLEDYEEVRKMWVENYENLEPPRTIEGKQLEREEWIQNDVNKINEAITLLSSMDTKKMNDGMDMVGNILPFLLMGGFSKSEIVAYLKAKLAAAKSVMENTKKKSDEADTMVERETHTEASKEMAAHAQAALPDDEEKTKPSLDESQFPGEENAKPLNPDEKAGE
jgi:hypothetical protein